MKDNRLADTPKTTIMVVEDDADLRRILRFQLMTEGFGVLTADNGETAFHLVQQKTPDLIVLDLMMPVMDGFNFLKRLRTMERTSRIPVIVLTASQDDRHRLRSLQFMADAYIAKPYDLQELTHEVQRLSLADRQVYQELPT